MVGIRTNAFAEERAEVEVLLNEAKKFNELGKKIEASLGRMRTTGDSLQKALGPGYNSTQPLHHINDNVNRMLATIDSWQKPLESKGQEERILREGPATAGVTPYLASLKRVEAMLSELNAKPLRINQDATTELQQLHGQANTKLQELFEAILRGEKEQIEPLHFITKEIPFPMLEGKKLQDLAAINSQISASQTRSASSTTSGTSTAKAYAKFRGDYLNTSLLNLASASISTAKKKKPDELYRRGTSGIGTYASGIEGLFVAEWQMITVVFGRTEWGSTYELTVRKAMNEFSNTLRELDNQVKAHLTTDCFLAYEIIDITNRLAFRIDDQTGQLKQQFIEVMRPVRDTARDSLPELLKNIKTEIDKKLFFPHDNAVDPFTVEVMLRMQRIASFPQPFTSILSSLNDKNWTMPVTPSNASTSSLPSIKSLDSTSDSNQILAQYVIDTIETLLSCIDAKSRTIISNKALLGLLIANQVAVIDRMIRTSDIQNLFASTNTQYRLDTWRKKGTGAYLDAWREPCAALMDVQYTSRQPRPPSGNSGVSDSTAVIKALSSKDKEAIKEKFKAFNAKFELLSTKHREVNGGMEKEIRTQLGREIQAMVEPLYGRFWDRYHEIDKGKGKYVKYDKGSLNAQITTLQ
ncbi:exocyst complex component exo70 [Agyrium rufum]|nr:exocyst complex component exo70 [Agyrium rufum]